MEWRRRQRGGESVVKKMENGRVENRESEKRIGELSKKIENGGVEETSGRHQGEETGK